MKVLLINGSPHSAGCTFTALSEAAEILQNQGIETEIVGIGKEAVCGCTACYACMKTGICAVGDALYLQIRETMLHADGLIIGSPVYYGGPNGSLCALLDRFFFAAENEEGIEGRTSVVAGKPAAAVVSCRRGGASAAFDRLNKYFMTLNMPVVTSQYWNSVHGMRPADVREDREGMQTMRALAVNMAWMLKCIKAGETRKPLAEEHVLTNFIRK